MYQWSQKDKKKPTTPQNDQNGFVKKWKIYLQSLQFCNNIDYKTCFSIHDTTIGHHYFKNWLNHIVRHEGHWSYKLFDLGCEKENTKRFNFVNFCKLIFFTNSQYFNWHWMYSPQCVCVHLKQNWQKIFLRSKRNNFTSSFCSFKMIQRIRIYM